MEHDPETQFELAMRHARVMSTSRDCPGTPFERCLIRLMLLQLRYNTTQRIYLSTAPRFLELEQDVGPNSITNYPEALLLQLYQNFPCSLFCRANPAASRWAMHLVTECGFSVEVAMLCALDRRTAAERSVVRLEEMVRAESNRRRCIRSLRPREPRLTLPTSSSVQQKSETTDTLSPSGQSTWHPRGRSATKTHTTRPILGNPRSKSAHSYFHAAGNGQKSQLNRSSSGDGSTQSNDVEDPGPESAQTLHANDKVYTTNLFLALQDLAIVLDGRVDLEHCPNGFPCSALVDADPQSALDSDGQQPGSVYRSSPPSIRHPDRCYNQRLRGEIGVGTIPAWFFDFSPKSDTNGRCTSESCLCFLKACQASVDHIRSARWDTGFGLRAWDLLRHISIPVDPYTVSNITLRELQAGHIDRLCKHYANYDRSSELKLLKSMYSLNFAHNLHPSSLSRKSTRLPGSRALTSGGRRALVDLVYRHTRAQTDEYGEQDGVDWSSDISKGLLLRSDQAIEYARKHMPDRDKSITADVIHRLMALLRARGTESRGKKLVFKLRDKKDEFLELIGREGRQAFAKWINIGVDDLGRWDGNLVLK